MAEPKMGLMLALPEVAQLVDRIPIARAAIKANTITLRFLQHAAQSKMPLRKQCEHLDIPWHARRVPAELAKEPVLEAARALPAAYFMQTMPRDPIKLAAWCIAIKTACAKGLTGNALKWVAFHGTETLSDGLIVFVGKQTETKPSTTKAEMSRRMDRQSRVTRSSFENTVMDLVRRQMVEFEERVLLGSDPGERRPVGVLSGLSIPRTGTSTMPDPNERVSYPDSLRMPFEKHGLTLTLLQTRGDFASCGNRLNNCISDRDEGRGMLLFNSKRDYFTRAKRRQLSLAMITRGMTAVAAVTFGKGWDLEEAKGPSNGTVLDPDILIIANEFAALAKANSIAQESQDNADNAGGYSLPDYLVPEVLQMTRPPTIADGSFPIFRGGTIA